MRCRHRFNDFEQAEECLPCAAFRSKARKACRKKSISSCWRPITRSSSAMRARRPNAVRCSASSCRCLSRRRPGFGPRLHFKPSGPWAFHALIQSCSTLRVTPNSRATGNTPSPPLNAFDRLQFERCRILTALCSSFHRSSSEIACHRNYRVSITGCSPALSPNFYQADSSIQIDKPQRVTNQKSESQKSVSSRSIVDAASCCWFQSGNDTQIAVQ